MEEISIQELFFILRKWIGMIFILFIISVTTAGLISYYVLQPSYETFTTLMIGKSNEYQANNKIEYNDLILNQKLVSTYGELVKSRIVTDKVITSLGLTLSYNDFRNKVGVSSIKDTEIIKIQVSDGSPQLATDIANETAIIFMDTIKEIMNVENVKIIDEAQVPLSPIKPRPRLNMAIAGVLGIMGGVFLAFMLEFIDNTLKTPEDVEKHLGLPVLGAIPIVKNE